MYLSRYSIKTAGGFRILLSEDSLRVTELMEHVFKMYSSRKHTDAGGRAVEQVTFMNGTE